MAEPFAIVGGVASILQIITSVTKLAKNLNEVRQSYDNVALNITLVASQLSTIRAALEALHTWRTSDTVETEASKQLDQDLGLSLSCCAILISVIDSKLVESGFQTGVALKQKIKYLWLEDILKEYVSNLEGQVRALQLLLTIFQCRTATEQKQQLAKAESRSIIEQIRAETMSLSVGDTEMDDAMSILSHDPSIHLDVDSILMKSPAYVRVYGEVKLPAISIFLPLLTRLLRSAIHAIHHVEERALSPHRRHHVENSCRNHQLLPRRWTLNQLSHHPA